MKILAFSDIHGDFEALERLRRKAEEVDVVVCAGDLTVFENELERVVEELDSFQKPVLVIHGNHELDASLERACSKTRNVKFIHGKHVEIKGVLFLGYGGGGFSFEYPEFAEVRKRFEEVVKNRQVVFIIHGPPYDTEVDELMGDHVGNLTMREFIDEAKPDVVICGHIHENFGREDKVGETYILNPGPEGRVIEV